jgi:hypothetical protein
MLRLFKADLHIHTCLSPCADLDMGPRTIVERAAQQELNVIGVSDHNSSENSLAVANAARGSTLKVLPGMEVTSKEEVHVLALFDSIEGALRLQDLVYAHLPGENDPGVFGLQVVVNEHHDVLGFNRRLLAGATELSIEQIVDFVHRLGGLAIASHVDRETFGIIGQLGFIPPHLELDALELSPHTSLEQAKRKFPHCAGYGFVRFSDAHHVDEIGRASTSFVLREPSVAEIKKSFRCEDGRAVILGGVLVAAWWRTERVLG